MTASSYKEPGYEPWRGRLRGSGIWRSRTNNAWEFLQVSFDHVMDITGIATEGHDATCGKTRRFYLYYSLDGLRFHQYIDPFVGDVSTNFTAFSDYLLKNRFDLFCLKIEWL